MTTGLSHAVNVSERIPIRAYLTAAASSFVLSNSVLMYLSMYVCLSAKSTCAATLPDAAD